MTNSLLFATLLLGQAAASGAADSDTEKAQQKKWNDYYAKVAAEYEITRGEDRKEKLELKPEAVLHWSNPIRAGETNGAVFVWTHEGRAALVGTIFSHLVRNQPDQKLVAHEFQSLTDKPLAGRRPGQTETWSLPGDGIRPQPIPESPPPAATRAGRLSQMRDMARVFSATTTLGDVEQELRLLPQPIHRQEKEVGEILDGTLFTFVTGTDPELMLVIEARPTKKDGEPVWHYTAGRFTDLTLKLRYQKVELWTRQQGETVDGRPDPYMAARYETRPKIME
jgi:hypothetical protein